MNTFGIENQNMEYKLAKKELPKSFWETVSAFANSCGGLIVLGVKEQGEQRIVEGVDNADKMITDIFNIAANPEKISYNALSETFVKKQIVDEKTIILVYVQEADVKYKPVHLNKTLNKTYVRLHDGDHLATLEDVKRMLRNSVGDMDSLLLENYSVNDLAPLSVNLCRVIVQSKELNYDYSKLSDIEFLQKIGAAVLDRKDGKIKITLGGLLFLGKEDAIKSYFPHFHLDYLNKMGTSERWLDRVAFGMPEYLDLNILNFYQIVLEKLKATINNSFQIDSNVMRKSPLDFLVAIQEALVNALIHADYADSSQCIQIERHNLYCLFKNPGKMKISQHQFFVGGQSVIRNNVLTTLFRRIGASDRAGTGGPKILNVVSKNKYRIPDIEQIESVTSVKLWMAVPRATYTDLPLDCQRIMEALWDTDDALSATVLQSKTGLSRYYLDEALKRLTKENIILRTGQYRSTKYSRVVSPVETLDLAQRMVKYAEVLFPDSRKV